MLEIMSADQWPVNRMTFDEAVMYCFCIGEGWRLPTDDELIAEYGYDYFVFSALWIQEVNFAGSQYTRFLRPVRDLKDD